MSGMTCQSARDVVLDLSRGVAIPSPLVRAVEAHLEDCAGCAAELQRQRELTAGLEAMAMQATAWKAPASVEQHLLEQFAAFHGRVGSPHTRRYRRVVWPASAAAALILCAVFVGTQRWRDVQPARLAGPVADSAAKTTAHVDNPTRVPTTAIVTVEKPAAPAPYRRAAPRRASVASPRAVEFIMLPDAAGLPAFESGTIVRMEVPVATLPAYGLKIPPDAARSNVEADLLVGQDGHARAIRLVSESEHSRSRQ